MVENLLVLDHSLSRLEKSFFQSAKESHSPVIPETLAQKSGMSFDILELVIHHHFHVRCS